jgi:hypothetical protein
MELLIITHPEPPCALPDHPFLSFRCMTEPSLTFAGVPVRNLGQRFYAGGGHRIGHRDTISDLEVLRPDGMPKL